MTIYWVRPNGDSVDQALAAVERALAADDRGVAPPAPPVPAGQAESAAYLAENLQLARETWAVDQGRIVYSRLPVLGALFNGAQQLLRRASWWYTQPQWEQASRFHGALLRAAEALVERQRRADERLDAIERVQLLTQIQSLEQQLSDLRRERRELAERVAVLELSIEH
jgi:hypothetical protein